MCLLNVSSKMPVVKSNHRTHGTAGRGRLSRIPPPPINSAATSRRKCFIILLLHNRIKQMPLTRPTHPLLSPAHLSRCLRGSSLCLSRDVTR